MLKKKNHLSILIDSDLKSALTVLVLHAGKVFTVVLSSQRLGTRVFLGKPRNMQTHTPFEIHSLLSADQSY